ncbi:MAG: minD 1 [Firmicutes bacterium]|nr:minD 1 [Bacillota bacterium]
MSCNGAAKDFQIDEQSQKISQFLQQVDHKIVVMSGKGGVGKSTVAANLAVFLSNQGYKVGLLDVDVHGPSIAGLFGLTGLKLDIMGKQIQPHVFAENLKIVSIQGLLDDPDSPLIWRGPVKIGIIRQFLSDVIWGPLDYLIIDSPPGTGDEPLTVAQTVTDCQAIIVTTPQEIALADVRKSIQFCEVVNLPILGIIENMRGFVCPTCGSTHAIFKSGGGEKTAADHNIPFLGYLPVDPSVVTAGDAGQTIDSLTSHTKEEMQHIVDQLIQKLTNKQKEVDDTMKMKIALPSRQNLIDNHFGHCEYFTVFTVDKNSKEIVGQETIESPVGCGCKSNIAQTLSEIGVKVMLAGNMGDGAVQVLNNSGIEVVRGCSGDIKTVALAWIAGSLVDSGDSCHEHEHGCHS